MIPTYRPKENFLREALNAVLQQCSGPEQMQIEAVDDCSPDVNVRELIESVAGTRVAFHRLRKNVGLAGAWNTCIERSRGQYVHILHQDDYVLPGFYDKLRQAAEQHPDLALLASRCFHVDQEGVIVSVTERIPELESGGRAVNRFFYGNPLQCPGVVIRRSFYKTHGGFRHDLPFLLDLEMWARAVGLEGGIILSDVLSCFRSHSANATGRLERSAESLRDAGRLIRLYAERYPAFDSEKSMLRLAAKALDQAIRFSKAGDRESAKANWDFWKRNVPLKLRVRAFAGRLAAHLTTRLNGR